MHESEGPIHLNDIALHQLKRQTPDTNITFIGGIVPTDIPLPGEHDQTANPKLILWIARHSVVPDQLRPRAVLLMQEGDEKQVLLNALVEAIIPTDNESLAPMMPGRIEVADKKSVQYFRNALAGIPIEIVVAPDMSLVTEIANELIADLQSHFHPIPPWDIAPEIAQDLVIAATSVFRRSPWLVLDDTIPVEVTVNRYGIEKLYISVTYGTEESEGIIAYFTLDDFHVAGKVGFMLAELEEAEGDINNLDLPPNDLEQLSAVLKDPDVGVGEAITVFYESATTLEPNVITEIRQLDLPIVSGNTVPLFTRVSRLAGPRRPNEEESRGLRLALEAFASFLSRQREKIENENWHFAPIKSVINVKDNQERVPIKVSITSPVATFDPALRDSVFNVRVYLNDDSSVWREIEILAQQTLWELDNTIQESFGWPPRTSTFLPRDSSNGDDTYESVMYDGVISTENAPIGLLLKQPRDFCFFMFDAEEEGIEHRVRLQSIGKRDNSIEYPRMVQSHGQIPNIYDPEDFDIDVHEDDDD